LNGEEGWKKKEDRKKEDKMVLRHVVQLWFRKP